MKLTIEQKPVIKQQILTQKTAIYALVNGGIRHQKQQIPGKVLLLNSTSTLGNVMLCNSPFFK